MIRLIFLNGLPCAASPQAVNPDVVTTYGHLNAEYFSMLRATPQVLEALRAVVPGVPDRRSCTNAQKREMEESEFKFGHGWNDWCVGLLVVAQEAPPSCLLPLLAGCVHSSPIPADGHTVVPLWRLRRSALIFNVDNTNTKIVKSGGACLIFDITRRGLLHAPSGCTHSFSFAFSVAYDAALL